MKDTISKAKSLNKIETTTQSIGLFLKASKTKAMHFNLSVESYVPTINGEEIERLIVFFIWGTTKTLHKISTSES